MSQFLSLVSYALIIESNRIPVGFVKLFLLYIDSCIVLSCTCASMEGACTLCNFDFVSNKSRLALVAFFVFHVDYLLQRK